jgi:RNA polymerase sigma-70 factor, ECF subfamily
MNAVLTEPSAIANSTVCDDSVNHETALIEAARRNPDALGQLYRQHYPTIFRYVARRVGNQSIAEDLVGDVFVAMVRYLPKYRIRDVPFHAWLYRLATNRVNKWARWERRRAGKELREMASKRRDQEQCDMANHVRTALLTLPLPFQTAVALHYLEEMSLAEISHVVDCSIGTVKSRLARGREMLRKLLLESDGAK